MPYYRTAGSLPPKRHIQFRGASGSLFAEELMGAEGFTGESALLYHRCAPTRLISADIWEASTSHLVPNHPLKPRHLRTDLIEADGGDLVRSRHLLLGNADLKVSYAAVTEPSPLYRNANGDECIYVMSGQAALETVFGCLPVSAGDYVVIPASVTHRWVPAGAEPFKALVLEASGHMTIPDRYLGPTGQIVEAAPYSERDFRAPSELVQGPPGEAEVYVRHGGDLGTRFLYASHPFDVVGWDGCLYPYAFNIADFEPIVGRTHLPPPVHQTFMGPNFVVCSFCPRPFDFDSRAVPVPYNHANVDSDEVLLYVAGDFMSRKGAGIRRGSLSLHPAGFIHGPHADSVEASLGAASTDETAVMIDTFRPLSLAEAAHEIEDGIYVRSWLSR